MYFFMGINQLAIGYRENNGSKKQGGVLAVVISLTVLAGTVYLFFKWVWWW